MRGYFIRTPPLLEKAFPSIQWRLDEYPQSKKSLSTKLGAIALTFDDGPHPDSTPVLLDILLSFETKASFFLLGANAERYPELVSRIRNDGHHVGNHGHNHINGWQSEHSIYVNNALKGGALLDSREFRPPFGKITRQQGRSLIAEHQQKLILWSLMPGDFDKRISPEILERRLLAHTRPRDIIVLHDTPSTIQNLTIVLPRYLQWLYLRGLQPDLIKHQSVGITR